MKSKLFLGFLLVSGAVTLLGGCASDNSQQNNGTSNVSTIPWNRPEKWEGPGVLGDQLNQGR